MYCIHYTSHIYLCTYIYIYIYICNHENSVPSRLSPQWHCGNSYTWVHGVYSTYIYIYIYMHIYTYKYICIINIYMVILSNKYTLIL